MQFKTLISKYKLFYTSKESHTDLGFVPDLSRCTVNYKHHGRTITLENLTLYQAVLLFIFNSKEEVSFRELTHKLVLSKQELICELEPLLQTDHQVLIKHPDVADCQQSNTFEDSDKIRLNSRAKFSRSFARLNTVAPSQEVVDTH